MTMDCFYVGCGPAVHNANVLFKSPKHVTHDAQWLFPGLSAQLVCFGCAVELLEEQKVVNVQKKQIIRELLQIFLRNSKILKLMLSRMEIFLRVWNTLFGIIVENQDQQLSELACECCIITLKGTNNELSVGNVVNNLVCRCKAFENPSLIKLLKSAIAQYPQVLETLCDDNATFIGSILTFLEAGCPKERCIPAWDLLTSVLSHLHQFLDVYIPPDILEKIVVLCVTTITEKCLDTEILQCLHAFIGLPNSCEVIYQYETSNLTTSSKSVLQFFKKMLMCSNIDSQIVTIKCIAVLADNKNRNNNADNPEFSSLQNLCLDKGIAEYLLELLSSSSVKLIQELLNCLRIVVHCKKFYTLGHVVYGFPAIMNAVSSLTNNDALYNGLCLVDVMVRNCQLFEKQNLVVQQVSSVNKLLKTSLTDFRDGNIKHVGLSCFVSFLQSVDKFHVESLEPTLDIIEFLFVYIETDLTTATKLLPWHVQFVNNCYEAVLLISETFFQRVNNDRDNATSSFVQESAGKGSVTSVAQEPACTANLMNILYYLCDRYFVPQAIVRLSSGKNNLFQATFYKIVLLFFEMISTRGQMLAAKLCRSSFISTVYESKVLASLNTTDQSLHEMFGKILFHLSMSVEPKNIQAVYETKYLLLPHLIKFSTPIHDWKSLLEPTRGKTDARIDHRIALFALIACSHMAGCPLISLRLLQPHIERFATNAQSLSQLSGLGKRYFLYICCHVKVEALSSSATTTTTTTAEKTLSSAAPAADKNNDALTSLLSESCSDASILFHASDVFLVWLLQLPAPLEFVTRCLQVYFSGNKNMHTVNDCSMVFDKLKEILRAKDLLFVFIQLSVTIIGKCTEECVLDNIMECVTFVIPSLSIGKITGLKQQINRQLLLSDHNNASGENTTAYLIRCLNTLEVLTEDYTADEDLKLLYRISSFIDEKYQPTCQLEALNFIYLILTKSRLVCDSKPISLFVTVSHIASFFEKAVFTNEQAISSSKESLLSERLTAAIVLTTSELVGCMKQFVQLPSSKIMVRKQLMIDCLVCADLPILQLAMLVFWAQVFDTKAKLTSIQFVGNNGDVSEVNSKDVRLVTVAIHGVFLSQDDFVRKAAAKCFVSLVDFFHPHNPNFLRTQWNQTLWKLVQKKISSEEFQLPYLIFLRSFMVLPDVRNTELFNLVVNIVEKCSPTETSCERDMLIASIVETFVDHCLGELDYTSFRRLKSALKSFQKKLSGASSSSIINNIRLKYANINGVIVLSYGFKMVASLLLTKTTKKIERRMDEIDDDQTDSGDETN